MVRNNQLNLVLNVDIYDFYVKLKMLFRSTVFDAMFSNNMLEAQSSIVNIQDLDADIVEDMVKYIYSGRVSNNSFS